MKSLLVPIVGLLLLAGCSRMLGLEEDYVLKKPLTFRPNGADQDVVLPPGTRVRATLVKGNVYKVEVAGDTWQGPPNR